MFTHSIRQACEIRKFHVAVVQRRQRNIQKSMMHVQSCCFADINLLLFNCSRCRRRRRCLNSLLLWSRNFATMVTWRHTSPLFSYAFRLTDVDFFEEFHIQTLTKRRYLSHTSWVLTLYPWPQYLLTPCVKISQLPLFPFVNLVNPSMFAAIIIFSHKLCNADQCRPNPEGASLGSKALVSKTKQLHPATPRNCPKCTIPRMFLRFPWGFRGVFRGCFDEALNVSWGKPTPRGTWRIEGKQNSQFTVEPVYFILVISN